MKRPSEMHGIFQLKKENHWQYLFITFSINFFNHSVTDFDFVHFWESDSFLVYCSGEL